jgi:hypothetical protein
MFSERKNHKRRKNCKCAQCKEMRATGCEHPNNCLLKAQEILDTLPRKWNPTLISSEDFDEEVERLQNYQVAKTKDSHPFDAKITTKGGLTDLFRIFGPDNIDDDFKREWINPETNNHLQVGTTHSISQNFPSETERRTAISYELNTTGGNSYRIPGSIGPTGGAALAIRKASGLAQPNKALLIQTTDKRIIEALTTKRRALEDTGFINETERTQVQDTIADLLLRNNVTAFQLHHKNRTHHSRKMPEMLSDTIQKAKRAIKENQIKGLEQMNLPPIIPLPTTQSAKLKSITQSLAYRGIRNKKEMNLEERRRTKRNIKTAQSEAHRCFGTTPKEKTIWKGTRHRDFSMSTRNFLWKITHDAFQIGSQWLRDSYSNEYRRRAYCSWDNDEIESLDHILQDCSAPGQKLIWKLAKKLWETNSRRNAWKQPSTGLVIACGTATFGRPRESQRANGEDRLFRILIAESAHLIWKIRCNRVINNENRGDSNKKVLNRWLRVMNDRMKLDLRLTHKRYGKKGIPLQLAQDTWGKVVTDNSKPIKTWVINSEGLVSIGLELEEGGEGESDDDVDTVTTSTP